MLYEDVKSLDGAKQIIGNQDMIIGKMYRKIIKLEYDKLQWEKWKDREIHRAGYADGMDFKDVWAEVLQKSFLSQIA